MIEVKEVTKYFGSFKALDSISFELKKGEVVGFLGPNGAGKTTTMRVITGFLPASAGVCRVGGLDVALQSLKTRSMIGYLPESTALYGQMETIDYLQTIGKLRRLSTSLLNERMKKVIASCGLREAVGKKISTLSKGYRQRVGLAQALLHDPEILILDEPTVGLDPNQIGEIRQLIREIGKNKTVLLSTHILSEVEQTCSRVIIISDGKIAGQGTSQELISQTRGTSVYHVVLRAAENEIREAFAKLGGFQGMEIIDREKDKNRIRLMIDSPQDQSEEIFKLAVAKQWLLSELRTEKMTLEEVFKKLTM